mmetsp:Transcript_30974/g.67949  ORF Transcript_30974/g.67949 Transcript_30974/m.67949 type:complete len:208 (-) Transcript_30974:999-1622(-)
MEVGPRSRPWSSTMALWCHDRVLQVLQVLALPPGQLMTQHFQRCPQSSRLGRQQLSLGRRVHAQVMAPWESLSPWPSWVCFRHHLPPPRPHHPRRRLPRSAASTSPRWCWPPFCLSHPSLRCCRDRGHADLCRPSVGLCHACPRLCPCPCGGPCYRLHLRRRLLPFFCLYLFPWHRNDRLAAVYDHRHGGHHRRPPLPPTTLLCLTH